MRKVFLSRLSKDKHYVKIVARHLGRAKRIFDEVTFKLDHNFIEEINKNLNSSSLFVFFASKNSLKSVWCKYEINKAYELKITDVLRNHLTIIIDRDIIYNDLPNWMQSTKVVIQTQPSQATRDIQNFLFSILSPLLKRPFVGRQKLQEDFIDFMSSLDYSKKRVFILLGLEGIGRRSYMKRITRDVLGLDLQSYIIIDETRTLDDLYIWALNETLDLGSRENLSSEIKIFSALTEEKKIKEIINRFRILCSDNCIPCLIDQGGMLDENGNYREEYILLLKKFLDTEEDHYLCLIHKRVPLFRELSFNQELLYQKVQPLDKKHTRLLIQQLFRKSEILASPTAIEEIIDYLDGYPPAAYFTTSIIKEYGLSTILADKSLLNDFKTKRFSKFISDLRLSEKEWLILQYLAAEQSIPLSLISVIAGCTNEEASKLLTKLINNGLVMVIDDAYSISPPIKEAIFRARSYLDSKTYNEIGVKLTKAFWADIDSAPTLEIVDATLHAVARSGSSDFDPYQDLVRPSIVHALARECYHKKQWELSLEYAKRAEQMGSDNPDIWSIHFICLVQLEQWKNAEVKLKEIENHGDKYASYLRGFMLRKKNLHEQAIKAFESALAEGNHSYPVYRDYADCLYRCKKYEDAFEKINWVLKRDSENIYVLVQ